MEDYGGKRDMELIEAPDKISNKEFMIECTCHCSLLRCSIFDNDLYHAERKEEEEKVPPKKSNLLFHIREVKFTSLYC